MYGAIIGDLTGSIYEYEQTKKIEKVEWEESIKPSSFYSDDTIMTIAILDAILSNESYEEKLREYGKRFEDYHPPITPYFKTPFSPNYMKWLNGKGEGNSRGNGAMMRISPIGYLFDSERKIIEEAKKATTPSHNSWEAVDAATIIAILIFFGRKGYTKEEMIRNLNIKLRQKPFEKFNTTCKETLDNCLCAFFFSTSFEDAMKKTLLYGGDTDTNCAIVGSIAESFYGIDEALVEKAKKKIPKEFQETLEKGYAKIKKIKE